MTTKVTSFDVLAEQIVAALKEAGCLADYAIHDFPDEGKSAEFMVFSLNDLVRLNTVIQKGCGHV